MKLPKRTEICMGGGSKFSCPKIVITFPRNFMNRINSQHSRSSCCSFAHI